MKNKTGNIYSKYFKGNIKIEPGNIVFFISCLVGVFKN